MALGRGNGRNSGSGNGGGRISEFVNSLYKFDVSDNVVRALARDGKDSMILYLSLIASINKAYKDRLTNDRTDRDFDWEGLLDDEHRMLTKLYKLEDINVKLASEALALGFYNDNRDFASEADRDRLRGDEIDRVFDDYVYDIVNGDNNDRDVRDIFEDERGESRVSNRSKHRDTDSPDIRSEAQRMLDSVSHSMDKAFGDVSDDVSFDDQHMPTHSSDRRKSRVKDIVEVEFKTSTDTALDTNNDMTTCPLNLVPEALVLLNDKRFQLVTVLQSLTVKTDGEEIADSDTIMDFVDDVIDLDRLNIDKANEAIDVNNQKDYILNYITASKEVVNEDITRCKIPEHVIIVPKQNEDMFEDEELEIGDVGKILPIVSNKVLLDLISNCKEELSVQHTNLLFILEDMRSYRFFTVFDILYVRRVS